MGDIKRASDLVGILQGVRRKCEETLRDRGDPGAALKALGPMLEAGSGQVHDIRALAPGLGDMWDTLRTVHALAVEALAWDRPGEGEGDDEGVSGPGSKPTRVGEPLLSRESGLDFDPDAPDPDD